MGIGRYRKITLDPTGKKMAVVSLSIFNNEDIFPNPGLWRWVFNKQVIGDKRFINSRMGEDQAFIFELGPFDKKITRSDAIVYEYFLHYDGQLTKNRIALRDLNITISHITEILPSIEGPNRAFGEFIVQRMLLTGIRKGKINMRISYSIKILFILLNRISSRKFLLLSRYHFASLHKK
jgi:hypothetical protein